MNIINDSIISKLLPSIDPTASIRLLKWHIEENVLKPGENYTSQICRLWIDYEKQDVRLSQAYFVKIPINSPAYETFKKMGSYDKEAIVYTKILPEMYRIETDYLTPLLHYSDDNLTMIFEDLSQSGYKCFDRRHQLDFEHCSHALRNLAKLHGLSVVAGKSPEIHHWMRYEPESGGETESRNMIMNRIPMFVDSLPDDIKSRYADQILNLQNIPWDMAVNDFRATDDVFAVLIHGDFWTNNIMFRYDDEGAVQNVKFIDFQFSRWGSPALDIIHFAISSMRFDVYERQFHQLLRIYLDTLNGILAKLNGPVYSMERLVRDIDERYHYACLVFSTMLPVHLADREDRGRAEEVGDEGQEDDADAWSKAIRRSYQQQLYIDVSTKWFLHFVHKGFLNFAAKA